MGTDLLPFHEVAALVATASLLGVLLLTPLYLSQRRDIQRLRAWMEQEPDHPAADIAVSEVRLDRFEAELERIYAERGEPVPGTAEPTVATEVHPGGLVAPGAALPGSLPPATRVTSERPALERITMERAALQPHQRWRHFTARATQPQWLAALALVALALAAGAIVGVQSLLEDDDGPPAATVDPSGIEVAVLNTTSAAGLAGKTSRQIEASGFLPGAVESFTRTADQTVVMYAPGQKRAGSRVARELEVAAVQEIDREVQRAAPTADVVVILGEDRAGG